MYFSVHYIFKKRTIAKYSVLPYLCRSLENPASGHSLFLNRQFWSCFKLFKNVLCWHGLLADKVLTEMALNSLLYRYLIIGLGVNPSPLDSVMKSRQIVNSIPSEWKKGNMLSELQRLVKYLSALGTSVGLPRDAIRDVANQLKVLSALQESETLEKGLLTS